jgi:hypothetical protein
LKEATLTSEWNLQRQHLQHVSLAVQKNL